MLLQIFDDSADRRRAKVTGSLKRRGPALPGFRYSTPLRSVRRGTQMRDNVLFLARTGSAGPGTDSPFLTWPLGCRFRLETLWLRC